MLRCAKARDKALKVKPPILPASRSAIARAAELLRAGRLVAFPTETVYGLGGDAASERAVAEIFAAKGRPRFNPLIVHISTLEEAEGYALFDERARSLAQRFWPGPLTLVLRRREGSALSRLVSAGLDTLALRAPSHPVAQALLRASGRAIAAPSANRSGRLSPTEARHVAEELGAAVSLILDGGRTEVGVESSVLDLSGKTPILLRPGGVGREELEAALGRVALSGKGRLRSPGMMKSHYAPSLPLRLGARGPARAGEALLAFGPEAPSGFAEVLWLSRTGDLVEAAANFFSMLRRLDRPPFTAIAVMPIPRNGLGLALNDRLRRAAGPR